MAAVAMNSYSEIYPNSQHVSTVLIGGGLIIVYELDLYERWIVHIRYVKGWSRFEDLFFEVVGKADEQWVENHFEDDDSEDFYD